MQRKRLTRILGVFVLGGLVLGGAPGARAAVLGVSAQVGTPGYGGTVWLPVAGSFVDVRLGFNTLSFDHTLDSGGNPYDTRIHLRTLPLLVDWYPFGFGFHLTGGAVYNDNHASYTAVPQNGEYVIDGVPYPADAVGTLSGTVTYPHFAPYIGLGFGDPFSGLFPVFFTADFGAFYQRSPNVTLESSNGSGNPAFETQLASEAARLRSDLGKYRWYPVVSLGVGVSF